MAIPRLIIGAAQGRSGKTTVTLGLCAALAARGLIVQPFKKGPDYIDPSWLSEAAGRPCRSLDPFFCSNDERLIAAFLASAAGADIAIVEGNHGLYDGINLTPDPSPDLSPNPSSTRRGEGGVGDESFGSTAAVARTLGAPILLVVNTARMGRSVAALVHGYQTFEPDTPIAGVILNNVACGRHEAKLHAAVERYCGIPVLGVLPRDEALSIPDRHLGLVPRAEDEGLVPAIVACRAAVERYFDLDAILAIARSESANRQIGESANQRISELPIRHSPVRLAVFRDRAFTFYYPENLEALEAAGAELVFVDAFRDTALPPVDGLVIGGGFPEMFMDELSANTGLRTSVKAAAEAGLPIYAECGGLMYLAQRIMWGDRSAEMAGVLPCDVAMTARPQGHGYVEATVDAANPFFPVGTVLRGHEFHNSRLVGIVPLPSQGGGWEVGESSAAPGGLTTTYRLNRGNGIGGGRDGLVWRNVLASYTHLHAAGAPGWAEGLVQAARNMQYAICSTQYGAHSP
ncbi:MAG: cobyrinate a,c-diamide synthase [Anaerolineae bacterium]